MSFNPATDLTIAAHTAYRGKTHVPKGDVLETPILEEVNFTVQSTGRQQRLPAVIGWTVSVDVVGPVADYLDLYQLFQQFRFGRAIGPVPIRAASFVGATDIITTEGTAALGNGLATGDAVMVSWDETAPSLNSGALSRSTVYYWNAATSTTGSLHTTAEDAGTGSNKVNLTTAGTGDWYLHRAFPLIVDRNTGVRRTYHNAIPTKLPALRFMGGQLLFSGTLEFRCLPSLGSVPDGSDAASFYTESAQAYTPPTFAGTEAVTLPVEIAWGDTAPWDSFECADGLTVEFTPAWTPLNGQIWPGQAMTFNGIAVTCKGRPIGITVPELQAKVRGELGAIRDGDDIEITGTGLVLTLKQAIADAAATRYSAAQPTVPELTWTAGGQGATDLRAPYTIAAA